jgi:hypothetical protein
MTNRIIGLGFGVLWVLLTAVTYTVGFVLGHFLLGNMMLWTSMGAVTGFLQWLLLRRQLERSG